MSQIVKGRTNRACLLANNYTREGHERNGKVRVGDGTRIWFEAM